jgi:hypothetical protein
MYDIIFCIFGCPTIQYYKEQILKINETWGREAIKYNCKILYFFGEEDTDLKGDNYIYLKGINNDYESASHKQNLGLKYIHENFDYKFVYTCGTDTYVVVKNLIKFIVNQDQDDNICIGGHGNIRYINKEPIYFHSGGAGIILSKNSVNIIYSKLKNMFDDWKSLCSNNNVTYLISACDVAICYYLYKLDCKFIKRNDLFFGCSYSSNSCCYCNLKQNIISCHDMSLDDFDNYTYLLESLPEHNDI